MFHLVRLRVSKKPLIAMWRDSLAESEHHFCKAVQEVVRALVKQSWSQLLNVLESIKAQTSPETYDAHVRAFDAVRKMPVPKDFQETAIEQPRQSLAGWAAVIKNKTIDEATTGTLSCSLSAKTLSTMIEGFSNVEDLLGEGGEDTKSKFGVCEAWFNGSLGSSWRLAVSSGAILGISTTHCGVSWAPCGSFRGHAGGSGAVSKAI